jgi:hypothetical protein
MTHPFSPEDRPDPLDRQPTVRARVPDHIHLGVFSTGAIVMTGPNEFVIDFVQNLGRPFQVVARVILPHGVMPQFVDALGKNLDLFRQRYGPLPTVTNRAEQIIVGNAPTAPLSPVTPPPPTSALAAEPPLQMAQGTSGNTGSSGNVPPVVPGTFSIDTAGGSSVSPLPPPPPANPTPRRLSPQEIYDELKIRDEILSGSYANAVMIGHGPYEFSFDFITNFYPQSAVSCRVFVASGQVALFYDSIKSTWEQFRQRLQGPQSPEGPSSGNPWTPDDDRPAT